MTVQDGWADYIADYRSVKTKNITLTIYEKDFP